MKKIIVSMLDRKACWSDPGCVINEAVGARQFAYAINSEGIPNYSPADFELYAIGEFDDQTGKVDPYDKPKLIKTGLEVFSK